MSRPRRLVLPGFPHHVCQRGNHGQSVFYGDSDYQRYLLWMGDIARREGLKIWAYCLMTNHIHLVVVPERRESLAATLQCLQTRHAQRINAEQGWEGHLWHARYFSCVLDERALAAAVRYVERNPVRAGMVREAPDYPWSSAPAHCGRRRDPVLCDDLPLLNAVADWANWLRGDDNPRMLARLRECTNKDLPCGEESFVQRLAQALGRPLGHRPRGRPRKA